MTVSYFGRRIASSQYESCVSPWRGSRLRHAVKEDFHCCEIFTRVKEIEVMYGSSRLNVKVEPRWTFTFLRGLSYIASISFMHVNFTCSKEEKTYVAVEINAKRTFRRHCFVMKYFLTWGGYTVQTFFRGEGGACPLGALPITTAVEKGDVKSW